MRDVMDVITPAWYGLAYSSSDTSILIRVNTAVLQNLVKTLRGMREIGEMQKQLRLPEFIDFQRPRAGYVGFGHSLSTNMNPSGEWLTYRCHLPSYTLGITGFEQAAKETCATLHTLFYGLFQTSTSAGEFPQILNAWPIKLTDSGAEGFYCDLSEPAVAWLQRRGDGRINEAGSAMHGAINRMVQRVDTRLNVGAFVRDWRLELKYGAASLEAPPDAPTPSYGGYRLVPHQVKTYTQTLALFAGIAAIHHQISTTVSPIRSIARPATGTSLAGYDRWNPATNPA